MDIALGYENQLVDKLFLLNKYKQINWNSPKQVHPVLNELGIFPKDKHGKPTIGRPVLAKYNTKITGLLVEYSNLTKFCNSFGRKFLSNINPVSKKVHTTYNTIKNTGRTSSVEPNLQQIPNKESYRRCFIGDFTVCDYSNMELRMAGVLSKEKTFIDSFAKDLDLHMETSKAVFKDELHRKEAKTMNFSILFGGSAFKLSSDFQLPVKKCEDILKEYWKTNSSLKH